MKRNYTPISRYLSAMLLLILIPALALFSQSPVTFNYQALLRDTDGDPRVNTSVSLEIEVHQGTITGTVVYSETHNTNTDAFGIVNLALGSVNPGSFETIDWSAGPYFVEVSVDGISMGTSELLAVPYAMHAAVAGDYDETDPVYAGSPAADVTAGDITNLGNLSGTNTGDQDISGIAVNASDITTLQAEQTVQDAAIAVNTAKVGLTPSQVTILSNTSGVNTGDQDGSETIVTGGTDITVTGTGTSGSPYVVNADGITSYSVTSSTTRIIADLSTSRGDQVQLLQIDNVPAGTYAVYFSSPIGNTSTSQIGINLAWAVVTNSATPSFPNDGIATSFIPATDWTANFIFGQSGFRLVNLGSTGSIDLVVVYYGNVTSGSVITRGTRQMIAIRL